MSGVGQSPLNDLLGLSDAARQLAQYGAAEWQAAHSSQAGRPPMHFLTFVVGRGRWRAVREYLEAEQWKWRVSGTSPRVEWRESKTSWIEHTFTVGCEDETVLQRIQKDLSSC